MNRYGLICRCILEHPTITQRELSQALDVSLGTINNLVKECVKLRYIKSPSDGSYYQLLEAGHQLLESYKVDGALIIAAGFGSRFVPLTFEMPKGLLEVFGERMIERQIKQLHEVGIRNITIAVGYLKEKFEYLIDKYDVTLLYNPEYSNKNTLTTIYRAYEVLQGRNMYVLCSDHWMRSNMFHLYECGAWYSSIYMEGDTSEWALTFNKKGRITAVSPGGHDCPVMYGPAFFSKEFSDAFLPVLSAYYELPGTEQFYWEQVYMELLSGEAEKRLKQEGAEWIMCYNDQKNLDILKLAANRNIEMYTNRQPANQVYEFENLEELRLFDPKYQTRSDNKAMELVAEVFGVSESAIQNIRCLKSGMTNKSFLFKLNGEHYICRIPGTGTELLINREEEKAVYDVVGSLGITEKIIYFDGETGYKIAEYYEGARNSNAKDWEDVTACMKVLRKLHCSALKVNHFFDIRERIKFYEELCSKHDSLLFEDYNEVHGWMTELLDRLDQMNRPKVLAHIDSVADNFLFLPDGQVRLIDWEYAGMCDPLIDVAMCAIYSYYNEEETDQLIHTYLEREPEAEEKAVVYSYIALGGFLWSLWAVYKSALGEEFGEYTIIMYRYAKRYYRKLVRKL